METQFSRGTCHFYARHFATVMCNCCIMRVAQRTDRKEKNCSFKRSVRNSKRFYFHLFPRATFFAFKDGIDEKLYESFTGEILTSLAAGAKISCGLCFRAANRYGDFATLSVLSLQINGITQLPSQFHAFLVDARLPI